MDINLSSEDLAFRDEVRSFFEENKIKSIILNQRAKSLRKKLRQDLYNDGVKNNSIEKIRQ